MFGTDTQQKMPETFLTDHTVWDAYMGQVWSGILSSTNFTKESSVIDIAPGSSIKLGAALARFDYCGNLYVVDSSAEALDALKKKYALLLPHAKIHWLCGPLAEQAGYLPHQPDYLLGNHILDDMILAAADAPQEEKNFSWAKAYEHIPTPTFQSSWQRLLTKPELLTQGKKTVEENLQRAIKTLAPRHLILSQYPSSTLYDHGLDAVNGHAFSVFTEMKAYFSDGLTDQSQVQNILNAYPHYGNRHIGEHILNAQYWMLWQTNKTA